MHVEERVFRLRDGTSVHCRVWQPRERTPARPALLLLHGVESHGQWFEELAPHLTAAGLAVYAPDRPGWGSSPGARGHLRSYDDALAFVEEVAAAVRLQHPELHLGGLSWGGKLALYAALRRPLFFESLTLIAPGLCPRQDLPRRRKLWVAGALLTGHGASRVRLALPAEAFTRRTDRISFIRTDPYRVEEISASFCLESLKMGRFIEEAIGRLRLPLQLLLAGEDRIIDNQATEALCRRAGSARVEVRHLEGAAHSLVFEQPERTAEALAAWTAESPAPLQEPRRVLVMGAGAVGSVLGGLLARHGHAVTLVARRPHAEAIERDGLHLHVGGAGRLLAENLQAVTEPPAGETFDLILLAVKSFDTAHALDQLQPLLAAGTPLLCLQNGVANEAAIRERFPELPLLAGAVCAYASLEEPGRARLGDDRGGLAVGPWEGTEEAAATAAGAVIADTGLAVSSARDGRRVKWSKLMLNVAFNPLSALTGLGTAAIMGDRRLASLALDAFAECAAVMAAQGIEPMDLPGYPVTRLARVMRLPGFLARRLVALATRREAAGVSSMAQDLSRQRARTEIDEINGAVVAAGEAHQVPTPANRHLVELLKRAAKDPALAAACREDPARVLPAQ